MSSATGTFALLLTVSAAIATATATYSFISPFRVQQEKDVLRIQELEEEIVRLKREMRSCGIRTSSSEDKKDSA